MKKVGIIILIVILINLVIVLSNVLISAIRKGENFMIWNIGEVEKNDNNRKKDEKIKITNISDIKINVKPSDVKLILTDEEELRIVQYANQELKDNEKVKINKNDTSIEISEPQLNLWYRINLFNQYKMAYDIYIPKNYKNNLDLISASGDIYLEDEIELKNINMSLVSGNINMEKKVNAQNIDINITSGDVYLKDVIAKKMKLKSVSGDINIRDNINIDEISMKSTSGTIETKDIESENVEIETTSGDIEIGKITGNLNMKSISGEIEIENLIGKSNLKTTSGNISINDFKILEESNINSTSGELKIYMNEESNCHIKTKTVSGNINLPNDRNVVGIEPYHVLNLETISGNITINNRYK